MTKEDVMKRLRESEEHIQNDFIDKVLDSVQLLLEKANCRDYKPTDHEREQFGKIYTIIVNMSNWF